MTTRLDLIKRAQVRIGDEPIATESDPGADTHVAIFDAVRDDLLSRYPWTWATVTRRLTRLVAAPTQHWAYFYQLPSEMLGAPRAVYDRDDLRLPFMQYELTENRLATDAEAIWLRYTKRAEMSVWPGYFIELVDTVLRSEFALSIREDRTLYASLREVAYGPESLMGNGGLFHQAKARDAQSKPSPIVGEGVNPLISVR